MACRGLQQRDDCLVRSWIAARAEAHLRWLSLRVARDKRRDKGIASGLERDLQCLPCAHRHLLPRDLIEAGNHMDRRCHGARLRGDLAAYPSRALVAALALSTAALAGPPPGTCRHHGCAGGAARSGTRLLPRARHRRRRRQRLLDQQKLCRRRSSSMSTPNGASGSRIVKKSFVPSRPKLASKSNAAATSCALPEGPVLEDVVSAAHPRFPFLDAASDSKEPTRGARRHGTVHSGGGSSTVALASKPTWKADGLGRLIA